MNNQCVSVFKDFNTISETLSKLWADTINLMEQKHLVIATEAGYNDEVQSCHSQQKEVAQK